MKPKIKLVKVKIGSCAHTQANTYQDGKSLLRKSLPKTLTGWTEG